MRSSISEQYKFAAIILASKQTSLVTSGVTLGFPALKYIGINERVPYNAA
jgi:hypothetical protein